MSDGALTNYLQPRGLTLPQAALFLRMSQDRFRSLVEAKTLPYPISDGVWDRHLLMDRVGPRSQVYFVRSGRFVKIGVAAGFDGVDRRMKDFQTSNPADLALLHTEIGDKERELALHRRFSLHRHRGEWFYFEGPLYAYVQRRARA